MNHSLYYWAQAIPIFKYLLSKSTEKYLFCANETLLSSYLFMELMDNEELHEGIS